MDIPASRRGRARNGGEARMTENCDFGSDPARGWAWPARIGLILGLFAGPLAAWGPPARATPAKPSIVLILTDDQDASLAAYMPNLKALARQGATFTHAYYNDPFCGPSRATILTGLYD